MHDGVRMLIERLNGDISSVAEREGEWKRHVDRVLHDEIGLFTKGEKAELTKACMTYDRAKLTADVLQLMAAGPREAGQGYAIGYADAVYSQTMTPRPAPQVMKDGYVITPTGATISATSHA